MLLAIKARADRATRPRAGEVAEDWHGLAPRWLLDRVRQFNRGVFNRFALTFAGGRGWLARRLRYAVVHHVGRRSGRPYATPVVAQPTEDGFIVPLPYGTEVDWVRNLVAAGGGAVRRGGIEYPVVGPEVVDQAAALPAFRSGSRLVIRLFGIERFLRLKRPPPRRPEEGVETGRVS